MFSYWEQQDCIAFDHIVVGAGITGLSTAVELAKIFPNKRIVVLERSVLPTGASTRNAGFACMGSITELLSDMECMDEDEVINLFAQRKAGLTILRNRLGDAAIGYAEKGSYELINPIAKEALKKIDYLNELLLPVNNKPSFVLRNERIKAFGFAVKEVCAMVENICEGEIHTNKMMSALKRYAHAVGVDIKTGAEVVGYEVNDKDVMVRVANPNGGEYILGSKTLSICTNAATQQLLPQEEVLPARGQVLITEPVNDLKFNGIFHMERGYYYFRAIDNRVLIGGGRNLDIEGETTFDLNTTEQIQTSLVDKLNNVVLPDTPYKVAYAWAGTMAFGKDKKPVIKSFGNGVFGAYRMGGMGIAIGSEAGRQLAELVKAYYP